MGQSKTCSACAGPFTPTERDAYFYRLFDVPAPRQCPRCRFQRRIAFRNERTIYRRACSLCAKNFISVYHPDAPYQVYCTSCFYSDNWDQYASGIDYDPQRSFFEQYYDLTLRAPKLGVQQANDLVNSDYTNHGAGLKDCYLTFACSGCEGCMFDNCVNGCVHVVDGLGVRDTELSYECVDCSGCYNLHFSQSCAHCTDSAFLYDCRSVNNCFMCANLRRGEYLVGNRQLSKLEYEQFRRGLDMGGAAALVEQRAAWTQMRAAAWQQALHIQQSENCLGDDVQQCKNCQEVFDLSASEDARFCVYGSTLKSCCDVYAGYPRSELAYECVATGSDSYHVLFSYLPWSASYIEYCINVVYAKHCFGSNQLHHSEYCILNKRYNPVDYEALRQRIISDMRARGEYGEFFPLQMSPFAYNETIAQDYYPITAAQAARANLLWRARDEGECRVQLIELPASIGETSDSILSHTLACVDCAKNYRIAREELKFYRRVNVPVPGRCPDCRHRARFALRRPRALYSRTCAECSAEVSSSLAPGRSERVLCEACFYGKVY